MHDDRARTSPTVNIDILLYDGFDELDGIGPYEVFDYALGYAARRGRATVRTTAGPTSPSDRAASDTSLSTTSASG